MEEVKKSFKEQEMRWKEERKRMRGNMKQLEKRIGELEKKEGAKAERSMIDGKEMERGLGDKMKKTEWKLERRERDEKRRNIIIKVIKKEDKRREIEGVLRNIEVRVNIGKIGKIGGDKEKGRKMILAKLGSEG